MSMLKHHNMLMHKARTAVTRSPSALQFSLRTISALALVPALSAPAWAQSYDFINIADDTGQFGEFFGFDENFPSVNNAGAVAFYAPFDAGGEGIFTGNGAMLTTIADTAGPMFEFMYDPAPAINDSGAVSFHAKLDGLVDSVFTGSGAALTMIADESSGPFEHLGVTSINTAGTVAFVATPADADSGENGIYTGNGGPITTIVDHTGPFFHCYWPEINDAGVVAFQAILDDGSTGIFISTGGPIATVADTSGQFAGFLSAAINDLGAVAFQADLDAGGSGIFIYNGSTIVSVADSSGPFDFFGPAAINNGGDAAFIALLDGGAIGIYAGDDPLADKIIQTGDSLFGSTVTLLSFSKFGLNDHGAAAFAYQLLDGRSGVALAVIPAPASLSLLGIAAFGLRRRRR